MDECSFEGAGKIPRRTRLRGEDGILWSSSPEIALLLIAVSGLITLVLLLANWNEAINAMFNGNEINPATGCRWGFEPADRYSCSEAGWWTMGKWVGGFFLLNLALFVWAVVRTSSNRDRTHF